MASARTTYQDGQRIEDSRVDQLLGAGHARRHP
jgi:hypothetical protein